MFSWGCEQSETNEVGPAFETFPVVCYLQLWSRETPHKIRGFFGSPRKLRVWEAPWIGHRPMPQLKPKRRGNTSFWNLLLATARFGCWDSLNPSHIGEDCNCPITPIIRESFDRKQTAISACVYAVFVFELSGKNMQLGDQRAINPLPRPVFIWVRRELFSSFFFHKFSIFFIAIKKKNVTLY